MKLAISSIPKRMLRLATERSVLKRMGAVLLTAILLPIHFAVAEPTAKVNGTDALKENAALVANMALVTPDYERMTVTATAYNSLVGQTDDTPCIAARGYDLCEANMENVIAANFLPMGAKILVPDLHGDQIFTVVDRMNARYSKYCTGTECRMDFWMREHADARAFGKQTVEIVILSEPDQQLAQKTAH